MWEGDRSRANGAEAPAVVRAPAPGGAATALRVAGGHAMQRAKPVRAEAIALSPGMSADRAFEAVLATYAAAVAENLRCVLTENDPEGAHQLRVALRRFRTYLRVFRAVVRRGPAKRLAWMARYVGAIVGELRDADVVIEDMLGPAAGADAHLLAPLVAWREDVRAKVRASLRTARATTFANDLSLLAANGEWRAKAKRREDRGRYSADALIGSAIERFEARATERGATAMLNALARHDLRKDLKALRYAAELSAGYDGDLAAMASSLKRLQTILGQLNDMNMLETFDPGIEAVAVFRERLHEKHAQLAPALIESASTRWRDLASSSRLRGAVRNCA